MSENVDITYSSWVIACADIAIQEQESVHKGETKLYTVVAKPDYESDFVDLKCIDPNCPCSLRVSIFLSYEMNLLPVPPGFDFVRGEMDLSHLEVVGCERKTDLH